eukprot:9542579-Karenia_brevis.AAC.1
MLHMCGARQRFRALDRLWKAFKHILSSDFGIPNAASRVSTIYSDCAKAIARSIGHHFGAA